MKVMSDGNKLSGRPGFCNKNREYYWIPLYDPRLNLLLGLNFEIITIGCAFAITASSAVVRSSNGLE